MDCFGFRYNGENNSYTETWSVIQGDILVTFSTDNKYLQYDLCSEYLTIFGNTDDFSRKLPHLAGQLYKFANIIEKVHDEENTIPMLRIIHNVLYPIFIQDDFTLEMLNEVSFSVSLIKSARKI